MNRTLASFLADRPEGELHEMLAAVQEARQRLRQEEERLKVEESLINDALSRKSRRATSTAAPGSGRLSRGQVLRILAEHGRPVTIVEATQLVGRTHPVASRAAVRNHMHRLKDEGRLIQQGREWRVDTAKPFGWDEAGNVVESVELEPVGPPDQAFLARRRAEQASANGLAPEAEERETGLETGAR